MATQSGHAPLHRREGIALAVIGVLALLASAMAFVAGQMSTNAPQVAASAAEDDAPRVPLPAGPRKYQ